MKKYKLKESVKDKLACLVMILFILVGGMLISLRNEQFDKKMTEMHTQISQKYQIK